MKSNGGSLVGVGAIMACSPGHRLLYDRDLNESPGVRVAGQRAAEENDARSEMNYARSVRCTYCDKALGDAATRDHVIPKNLIPLSRRQTWKPVLVPACRSCNEKWADDEEHFRNVVNAAGDLNLPAEELFRDKIKRSFDRPSGMKKISDILKISESVEVDGQPRLKIYPARDPRVRNVVRKFVLGLSSFHGIENALSPNRIYVDVLRFVVPSNYLARLQHEEPEPEVIEYWYGVEPEPGVHSLWILRFYDRIAFIALVSESRDGDFGWNRNAIGKVIMCAPDSLSNKREVL